MSTITRCPTCNTRFKVTQEQLDAHRGLVRCGCCQAVFNATEYLQDDQPSSQLDLPIASEAPRQESVETVPEPAPEPASATHETLDSGLNEPAHTEQQNTDRQDTAQQDKTGPADLADPGLLAQNDTVTAPSDTHVAKPVKKKMDWLWIGGSLLLSVVLLAQAAYFFRIELAANQPGLKQALISYCRLLQCTVPLPQKADLMSIESSELEADPAQSSVIILNALLRNHASYIQAYPDLELTLTDAQDKPLARHIFHPKEYLKSDEDEKQGLAASRELGIKLNLDTTDLKPSGYRLLLFYPQ